MLRQFVIFLVLLCLFPAPALAKSYTIDPIQIDATVNRDGSMDVTETRSYNFDGSYTFAYQSIHKTGGDSSDTGRSDPYLLRDIRICEEGSTPTCYRQLPLTEAAQADDARPAGTYYVREDADQYYVKWFYAARDETIQFQLKYTVTNAVTLQSDADELYWQLIGSAWEIGEQNITASIHLPSGIPDDQIKAWAHGPLSGRVSIPTADLIAFSVPSVPAGQFFEARILLPSATFTGGARGTFTQTQIIGQENNFIRSGGNFYYSACPPK